VIAVRYLTYDEAVAEIKYWVNRLEELVNSSDPSAVDEASECVDALVEIGDLGVGHVLRRLMEKAAPEFRPVLAKGAELLEPIELVR
jgi:ssDNA-binding replication factor A large subunit